jgi:transposase InsO family protein
VARSNLTERLKKIPSSRAQKHQQEVEPLADAIKEVLKERPTYGYRRISACLRRGGVVANHKRVYRVMKEKSLLLRRFGHRIKRAHTGKVVVPRSNERWCSDSFSIQCFNGEQVHVAFSIDACDREAMRYIATTGGICGKNIQDLMLETIEYRFGKPVAPCKVQWLTDNGSCYTAKGTVALGQCLGLDIRTTLPYSPESNGVAEAFVKTFKRDYVLMGDLRDPRRVMEQLPAWFKDYNEMAPHKGLKMRSPRQYLKETKLAA